MSLLPPSIKPNSPNPSANNTQHSQSPTVAAKFQTPQCHDFFIITADPQYDGVPHKFSLFRSSSLNDGIPGGSGAIIPFSHAFGTPYLDYQLNQDALATEDERCMPHYKGRIGGGDYANLGGQEELTNGFFATAQRLVFKNWRHRLRLKPIGNHDRGWNGFSVGSDFGGPVFQNLVLKAPTLSDFNKLHWGGEVGGNDGEYILQKPKFFELSDKESFGEPVKPTVLLSSFKEGDPMAREYTIDPGYTADGFKLPRLHGHWYDSETVFQDFWRMKLNKQGDISWEARVEYKPNERVREEEEKMFGVSAILSGTYPTQEGPTPVYIISMDHQDNMTSNSPLGVLKGNVSKTQVRVVKAFMEKAKRENPRAKFILVGHYPADSLERDYWTSLHEILDDDAVILCICGHIHKRGYDILYDPKRKTDTKIDGLENRKTPLPVVAIPAVGDFPNEVGKLKLIPENGKLRIQITYHGIKKDEKGELVIPADTADVKKEFAATPNEILLPLLSAYKHITDRRLLWLALSRGNPDFLTLCMVILDSEEGLLFSLPSHIRDFFAKADSIHLVAAMANSLAYFAAKAIKLTLLQVGLVEEAEELEKLLMAKAKRLQDRYDKIAEGHTLETTLNHGDVDELNLFEAEELTKMTTLTSHVLKVIHGEEKGSKELSTEDLAKLVDADHLIVNLQTFLVTDYTAWVNTYESNKKFHEPDSVYTGAVKLLGEASSRAVIQHLFKLRQTVDTNPATAYFIRAALKTAILHKVFFNSVEDFDVPDKLDFIVSGSRGLIQAPPPLVPLSDEEKKRRLEKRKKDIGWVDPPKPPNPLINQTGKGHTVFRNGFRWNAEGESKNFQECVEFGGLFHLLKDDNPRHPQVDLAAYAGICGETPTGLSLYGKSELLIGLRGVLGIGPYATVGADINIHDKDPGDKKLIATTSMGGTLQLLEGINLSVGWRHLAEQPFNSMFHLKPNSIEVLPMIDIFKLVPALIGVVRSYETK